MYFIRCFRLFIWFVFFVCSITFIPQVEPAFEAITSGLVAELWASEGRECMVQTGPVTSGAATASIPLSIPPGPAGLVPPVVLTYNSMGKAGWMGKGWNLELGSIQQRGTKDHKKYYYVQGDKVEELVKINEDSNECYAYECQWNKIVTYGLKSNKRAKFKLILHYIYGAHGNIEASSTWRATINNIIYTFGTEVVCDGSPLCALLLEPIAVRYGSSEMPFFKKWGLIKATDQSAEINIAYYADSKLNTGTDLMPKSLTYNQGKTGINFDINEAHEVPTLTDVRSTHNGSLVRKYHLEYDCPNCAATINRLASVTEYGDDDRSTRPPITMISAAMCQGAVTGGCGLLGTLDNGRGGKTTFEYGCKEYGYPLVRKKTVENGQAEGIATTIYAYEGGKTNDADSFIVGTVIETRPDGSTATIRYQGGNDELAGLPKSIDQDGPIPSQTTFDWDPGKGFILLKGKTTQYDNNAVTVTETYSYDDQNNIKSQKTTSNQPNRNTIVKYYEWENVSKNKEPAWWRLSRESLAEIDKKNKSTLARSTGYTYYGPESAFYRELKTTDVAVKGSIDTKGKIKVDDSSTTTITNYINRKPARITRPSSSSTAITYDEDVGLYPQETRRNAANCPELVTTRTYHSQWGAVETVKDENEKVTTYDEYDVYGRLKNVSYPDGGAKHVDYDDSAWPNKKTESRAEGNASITTGAEYYDGFGRIIQTVTPLDPRDGTVRYSVTTTITATRP
jgi:hypothetical protein